MLKEVEYLARTIYGEARGENLETQLYVAWCIRNRVNRGGWMGSTYEEVVTKPWQYSCWNKDDPNYNKIQNPDDMKAWSTAKGIAEAVYMAHERFNPIPGILHYYDKSLDKRPPAWAKGAEVITFAHTPNMRWVKGVA